MRTMLETVMDEYDQEIEYKYTVPINAIQSYLDTDSIEEVDRFLNDEYISNDTRNIVELCELKGYEYKEVYQAYAGEWNL